MTIPSIFASSAAWKRLNFAPFSSPFSVETRIPSSTHVVKSTSFSFVLKNSVPIHWFLSICSFFNLQFAKNASVKSHVAMVHCSSFVSVKFAIAIAQSVKKVLLILHWLKSVPTSWQLSNSVLLNQLPVKLHPGSWQFLNRAVLKSAPYPMHTHQLMTLFYIELKYFQKWKGESISCRRENIHRPTKKKRYKCRDQGDGSVRNELEGPGFDFQNPHLNAMRGSTCL